MKILQITSHLNVGGIPRYVLSLSKKLIEHGHRVVIASDGGHMENQARALGATHWRLPFHTSVEFSPQVFYGTHKLISRLRSEPVDLIHAHTRVGQVAAQRIFQQLSIPYVTTWHGIYERRLGRRLWPCMGERVIAISGPVRDHLAKDFRVPEAGIRLIYNGVDTKHYAIPPDQAALQEYRKRHGIPEGHPTIGGIGRLASGGVKGFDLILAAASLLKETFPNLRVLIVGGGPRRSFLEDVARRLGIWNQVHFVGPTEDVRVPLALTDLFLFPSRWPEAFGLTLVEAMAAGKPVIATRVGAVPEIVAHGESGWLVSPDDPSAMAEGVKHLLTDRALAQRIARQGQLRAQEMFGIDRMAAQIEAVYQELV
jgi:glycosyltransferase involved in cell wall biosynthesis